MSTVTSILVDHRFLYGFIASLTLQFAIFHIFKSIATRHFTSVKARAWVLSCFTSAIMVLATASLAQDILNGSSIPLSSGFDSLNSLSSWILASFFMAFLFCDLVLGTLYYFTQLNPFTCWFHHISYIMLIIYLLQNEKPGLFCMFGIAELPTFILSCGMIEPSFRSDILFGTTFFLTRIVYHVYLSFRLFVDFPSNPYFFILAAVVILPVHFSWFYGWILQQLRLGRERTHSKVQKSKIDDAYDADMEDEGVYLESHKKL